MTINSNNYVKVVGRLLQRMTVVFQMEFIQSIQYESWEKITNIIHILYS